MIVAIRAIAARQIGLAEGLALDAPVLTARGKALLARTLAVDAGLVGSAGAVAPTVVGVVEVLKGVTRWPSIDASVAEPDRTVAAAVVGVCSVVTPDAAWFHLARATTPGHAGRATTAPIRADLTVGTGTTAAAVVAVIDVLEGVTGTGAVGTPLPEATRAIAAAVLDVADVIEGVARAIRDRFEFAAAVAAHITRLAGAASELAHAVITTGAVTATVLRVVEVLERVADAQAVVARLTLRAGAAATTVAAVGLMSVGVARAR